MKGKDKYSINEEPCTPLMLPCRVLQRYLIDIIATLLHIVSGSFNSPQKIVTKGLQRAPPSQWAHWCARCGVNPEESPHQSSLTWPSRPWWNATRGATTRNGDNLILPWCTHQLSIRLGFIRPRVDISYSHGVVLFFGGEWEEIWW